LSFLKKTIAKKIVEHTELVKKIMLKSEMITNDNGETFIIYRKQIVENNYQLITETITETDLKT
jgi:hypothetical protein